MKSIDKHYPHGYIRPYGRGVVFMDEEKTHHYLDDLMKEAAGNEMSPSSGCRLKNITIKITFDIER